MTPPVLIIGAGPVGLTLASELTRYGVGVRIVDKAPERTDKSKALVLWSRTLELLDRGMGAAPFVEAGFKVDGMTFVAGEKTIGRVAISTVESAYNFALMLPQSETERLLGERLTEQGVTVERGVEATGFVVGPDDVEATLRHLDGREEKTRAPWLVGCDGAHSAVRHALDLPFSGETMLSDWVLADIHMTGYPRADTDASIYWHRDGVLIIFPISPGRYRILADLPSSGTEQPPTPTPEEMQQLVDHRGPPGTKLFDPIWLSGFRINGRKVADYRHGRVFVAGDAAHIHSPAGGQGMNTGMQDAFNLAWKLALVVQGACKDDLLDSYSIERTAVGDEVLKAADRLTEVGTLKNPVVQHLRNLAAHVALGLPGVADNAAETMAEIKIGYPQSPLNGPAVHGGPHPGERLPPEAGQPAFGSGRSPTFTLCAAAGAETDDLIRRFGGLLAPNLRPPVRDDALWLIRPDGYVAMAASVGDGQAVGRYLNGLSTRSVAETVPGTTDEPRRVTETIPMGGLEVRFLRSKDETAGSLDLFQMTVRPDARMPVPHYHETWDETVIGLSGTTTWRIDGRDVEVKAGQNTFIRRGVVHGFRNDTREPASCLCILTPGVLGPGYFREVAALLAKGAPDPATMRETMLRHGLVPVPTA